jgi:hypothetical protein
VSGANVKVSVFGDGGAQNDRLRAIGNYFDGWGRPENSIIGHRNSKQITAQVIRFPSRLPSPRYLTLNPKRSQPYVSDQPTRHQKISRHASAMRPHRRRIPFTVTHTYFLLLFMKQKKRRGFLPQDAKKRHSATLPFHIRCKSIEFFYAFASNMKKGNAV